MSDKMARLNGKGESLSIHVEGETIRLDHLENLPMGMGGKLLEALGRCWPRMPFYIPSQEKPLPSFMMKRAWDSSLDHVMFYPGSFNPWHQGHRFCLESGMKTSPHFHFVVVPDCNPWKNTCSSACPWEHFRDICRKTENLFCCIYPGFWGRGKKNHTVDWLPLVKVKKKGLLLGGDGFLQLFQWKNHHSLLSSLDTLLVVQRTEYFDRLLEEKQKIEKNHPSLKVVLLKGNPFASLSSSSLR